MEMGDNYFQLDGQRSPLVLEVAVGQEVTINLVNNGQAVHNMHVAGVDNTYDVDFCEVGADEPCLTPATWCPATPVRSPSGSTRRAPSTSAATSTRS